MSKPRVGPLNSQHNNFKFQIFAGICTLVLFLWYAHTGLNRDFSAKKCQPTRVFHFRVDSWPYLLNIRLDWKGLKATNTSFLRTFVNYGRKKLNNIGYFGLSFKTWIVIYRKQTDFIVSLCLIYCQSLSLDKHYRLLRNP